MDCCRSSLRLGAKDVKVMARKPRQFFKASEWELEDAEVGERRDRRQPLAEELRRRGRPLNGMLFDKMEYEIDARGRIIAERVVGEQFFPADDVILAIGQENAFPWIEHDLGIEFDKWDVPVVDREDAPVHAPRRVLRRRCGVRPEEHHLGRRARPPGGDLDPQLLHGPAGHEPAAADDEPVEPQDGHARVVVQERLQPRRAAARAARRASRSASSRSASRSSSASIPSRPRPRCSAA